MAPRYGSIQVDEKELSPLTGRKPRGRRICHQLSSSARCVGLSAVAALLLTVGFIGQKLLGNEAPSTLSTTPPLSLTAPDLQTVIRAKDASPSAIWGKHLERGSPLPTNSWYLNLVSHRAHHSPDESTRAYTVPYIIDTAAAPETMSGIRVHWPVLHASTNNVQMLDDFKNGISLGTMDDRITSSGYKVDPDQELSLLGVSLRWSPETEEKSGSSMVTHIVRGMPYATMRYSGDVLPSLYSYNAPATKPIVDGSTELDCGVLTQGTITEGSTVTVQKEIRLHFINSDFSWILFVSRPVKLQCGVSEGDIKTADFQLDVVESTFSPTEDQEPLVVRLALVDACTTGKSNIQQHCNEKTELQDHEGYVELLRNSSHIFPASPQVDFEYPQDESQEEQIARIHFDWDAQSTQADESSGDLENLLMFALPHHQEELEESTSKHCIPTFHGKTCLVKADKWSLSEDLSRPQSFTARRPPQATAIPALAEAISKDIHYRLSDNMLRGAADTYFSGKIVARVARTIVIASELKQLASEKPSVLATIYDDLEDDASLQDSMQAAAQADLPSYSTITAAVEQLKKGVQIWLENAEAPYIYDSSWGGMVNCGCTYDGKGDKGVCNNTFPECPALADVNIDFGNGYYNDHHFHYGYHVYAAAVVAKYDPTWGKEYFDKVLLYIRDFANPSENDKYFTPWRQKDWYLGSSWASGIVSAENSPHGRNEESSSEAIAAYESMALFGQVMVEVMEHEGDLHEKEAAKLVRDAGELLTITEVEAANRYWHVWTSDTHKNTYPEAYTQPVVGMLYETMASFQTWFSPQPVVSYGIQLLPFTPVAEIRDDPYWAAILYPLYKKSCLAAGDFCIENGWSIIQSGLHATAGNRKEALKEALSIPDDVFDSQGGIGNSLSNTIWYIATRKEEVAAET